ncbi:MAG: caspase family protein [Granulosicoccaceae bacterium]
MFWLVCKQFRAFLLVVVGCASLFPVLCQAKVHALVVGIDKYLYLPALAGAVNDAQDIASALETIPNSDVTVLIDQDASLSAIERRWFSMLENAKPGDTVILSYAGHGSRVPELVAGSEADGQDDVFVLPSYNPNIADTAALLRDNQLFEWFQAADGKGVQLLFVADSCHSGTMTRAADSRLSPLRTRQVNIDFEQGLTEDTSVNLAQDNATTGRSDLPYLTFLSAGLESQQIPEIVIKSAPGKTKTRGALSFAVARALEGEADSNGDHLLSREELRHYVIENVQVLSERQQTPELSPLARLNQPVLALSAKAIPLETQKVGREYALYADDLEHSAQVSLSAKLPDLRWVTNIENAELYWDVPKGELLSTMGDLIARNLDVTRAHARLRGVLDKRTALRRLHRLSRSKILKTGLLPDASSHRLGQIIEPSFYGQRGEYLLILNLAGDGTVQLLYPLSSHADPLRHGLRRWSLPLRVAKPLGEDHMVALAFAQPQPDVLQAIEGLNGQRAPLRLLSILEPHLLAREVEVGIVGMFSRP